MTQPTQHGARGRTSKVALALGALVLFVAFSALGVWQVERRAWKLALIERVDTRVHAPSAALPAEGVWPGVSSAIDEYRHVSLTGRYLPGHDTLVQAATVLGGGFWVLTPLQQADGSVVLVNRGFVSKASQQVPLVHGTVMVTGLLRLTEPGGGFLRKNDPAADRWFSRDVAAISAKQKLQRVAPFFVDAQAAANAPAGQDGQPVGGLTVIAFYNSHLVYAITWFALALMVAAGAAVWTVHNAKRHDDDYHPIPH